jgi:hypothetical protein
VEFLCRCVCTFKLVCGDATVPGTRIRKEGVRFTFIPVVEVLRRTLLADVNELGVAEEHAVTTL